jgi:pyridoxamine 5'-phosphate oxidase
MTQPEPNEHTQPEPNEHPPRLTAGDFTAIEDPFALFAAWLAEAALAEPSDPNAMTLATVDPSGAPNARIVLLKGVDAGGFVFYTNQESIKGRELAAHPKAAAVFHWKSLGRQVRVRGMVEPVTAAEADSYFATRPRLSQIGAWASQQSRPLPDRAHLESEVARRTAEFGEREIPRPPHWSGYRLTPLRIEFWHERPFRLHDRLVFERAEPGAAFTRALLYP